MVELPKILVVDDGDRSVEHALSMELAELGFSSVTTSLEATEAVLDMLPTPSAIVLQLPRTDADARQCFLDLADNLSRHPTCSDVPVFLLDPRRGRDAHAFASLLEGRFKGMTTARA